MEIYKRFLEDKPLMLKMLKSGERTHHEIISNLEKRYNVTDKAKDLINGLNKLPQDQTVNEWLAEYSIS
jgi:hypothetical protein